MIYRCTNDIQGPQVPDRNAGIEERGARKGSGLLFCKAGPLTARRFLVPTDAIASLQKDSCTVCLPPVKVTASIQPDRYSGVRLWHSEQITAA